MRGLLVFPKCRLLTVDCFVWELLDVGGLVEIGKAWDALKHGLRGGDVIGRANQLLDASLPGLVVDCLAFTA